MGLPDRKCETFDSLDFETAPKHQKSKKHSNFRPIHSFFSLKKTASLNVSTIPELIPEPVSKPSLQIFTEREEAFESFSGPLSSPPNQKLDEPSPYQKGPATFPRPSSSPSISSLPENESNPHHKLLSPLPENTKTLTENSSLPDSPNTTNLLPPPLPAPENSFLSESASKSTETSPKVFSLPVSAPEPRENVLKKSSLPESASVAAPMPPPQNQLPVKENMVPETVSKTPRRRSWCTSESNRPNFTNSTNFSKKGGMGGAGTIVPMGILPARVNTIREHTVEGGGAGILYGLNGGIGSVSAHFVREYGKEDEEEEERGGEGGAGNKFKRNARRQSLEYGELEAVRERLTQAACLWKGLSGEIFYEHGETAIDGFSVLDDGDEEALHRAVMAELERKRCPMKMRVSVGAMGKDKGALKKWAFKKWFGKVKARREEKMGEVRK